jgi:hypothetical protein
MTFELNEKALLEQGFQKGRIRHANYDPSDRRNYRRTAMMN